MIIGYFLVGISRNVAYCDQILGFWVIHVEVPNSSNIFGDNSIFGCRIQNLSASVEAGALAHLYPCPEILEGGSQKSLFE